MSIVYEVWSPDYGSTRDDARQIGASNPDEAACRWARRRDAEGADYLIVGGQVVTVMVALGDQVQAFSVSGEAEPVYRARAIPIPAGDAS